MAIQKFYRTASVSTEEAIQGLKTRFPGAELVSFNKKGNQYIAELKMPDADMDAPAPDDSDMPDLDMDAPKEESPHEEEKEEHEDDDKDTKIIDMLKKIMDHLHISDKDDEGEEGDEGLDLAGGDLPDVGAPPAGEPMPSKLPPPVPNPKANKPGMPAFSKHLASVADKHTFNAYRKTASELNNKELVAEAEAGFAGYRVVKLDRIAKANEDVAILTMQKKAN